jgi:hypothetical protein
LSNPGRPTHGVSEFAARWMEPWGPPTFPFRDGLRHLGATVRPIWLQTKALGLTPFHERMRRPLIVLTNLRRSVYLEAMGIAISP